MDAMADCVFPEDIMLCILTRLPVKSLLRFKSVCKPWRELFAAPKFIKMHYDQFSSYAGNEAFIFDILPTDGMRTVSLFSFDSGVNEPVNLDPPYHVPFELQPSLFSVGFCNGIVCMGILFDLLEAAVALWNPALRLSKFVKIPEADFNFIDNVTLGFGYDYEGGDFRVVKIVYVTRGNNPSVQAGVYSAKSDTWSSIELPFKFKATEFSNSWVVTNNAIVNGNPYWVARVDKNEGPTAILGDVLVWFDMTGLEFKIVPLEGLGLEEPAKVPIVDWNGSLAALLCTKKDQRLECLDVWVFDDGDVVWRKKCTFGPFEMNVDKCLQCSKNGMIMGNLHGGKYFVLDPGTKRVKEIEIGEYNYICGYNESLVCIEGMEHFVLEVEEEFEVEEEMEMEEEEEEMEVEEEEEEGGHD